MLLLFAPANVIDFSVIAASKESMPSLVSYLRAKKPGIEVRSHPACASAAAFLSNRDSDERIDLQIADGPAVDPFWASIVLAGAAGLTGALTFSAAQRWARVYFKVQRPYILCESPALTRHRGAFQGEPAYLALAAPAYVHAGGQPPSQLGQRVHALRLPRQVVHAPAARVPASRGDFLGEANGGDVGGP